MLAALARSCDQAALIPCPPQRLAAAVAALAFAIAAISSVMPTLSEATSAVAPRGARVKQAGRAKGAFERLCAARSAGPRRAPRAGGWESGWGRPCGGRGATRLEGTERRRETDGHRERNPKTGGIAHATSSSRTGKGRGHEGPAKQRRRLGPSE